MGRPTFPSGIQLVSTNNIWLVSSPSGIQLFYPNYPSFYLSAESADSSSIPYIGDDGAQAARVQDDFERM
ncbi:hypothetical protein FF1_016999 [Malus domestica]